MKDTFKLKNVKIHIDQTPLEREKGAYWLRSINPESPISAWGKPDEIGKLFGTWLSKTIAAMEKKQLQTHQNGYIMGIILSCNDCPFNGQDNVFCRTCSIPAARAEKLAHRLARHRRRASARRRRWFRKQSMVNELINIQLEEVETRYDPYWD